MTRTSNGEHICSTSTSKVEHTCSMKRISKVEITCIMTHFKGLAHPQYDTYLKA